MKQRRFEYRGLAVVMIIYLVMTMIVLMERAGIGYQLFSEKVTLLPAASVISTREAYLQQDQECVVLYDSNKSSSLQAVEQFRQIFLDMKVGCDWVDVQHGQMPELDKYRTATVLMTDLSPLGEWVIDFADWVEHGGRALLPLTPEKEFTFMLIEQKMGILESSYTNERVESIHFVDGFMLGGAQTVKLSDAYESAKRFYLREDVKVYAYHPDDRKLPLIWSYDYGKGRFVVGNFGIMSKAVRGIYAACYSLLEDAFAYPVINGSAFYLDDFPAVMPTGNRDYLRQTYNMNPSEFYSDVWWHDLTLLAEKYGVRYTGAVIETYEDDTDGTILPQEDPSIFRFYGDMLLRNGGEISLHGYNHQPLCLNDMVYGDDLPLKTWNSTASMQASMIELIRFVSGLYPDVEDYVYVPASNILSEQGRELIRTHFPQIHTIASVYLEDNYVYTQEFGVAQDGIVEQPRVISGGILNDYARLAALSELNMHLVNTHSLHPENILDEEDGVIYGWEEMHGILDNYMHWLYSSVPSLRNLTGTELSGAIQRYGAVSITRSPSAHQLKLSLENLTDEAYLLVRLEGKRNPIANGGKLSKLTDSLYLLTAYSKEVTVFWDR